MIGTDLPALSIADLQSLLRRREVSPREVIDVLQGRIEAVDGDLGAYLSLDVEAALKEAEHANVDLPLGGIPIAIKDIINVMGQPCTCASKILHGYRGPYNATVIEKLRAAGAIPFGKTNLDEFAMGSSTENSALKSTRNPWDLSRVPGGSSGGSAAAVAADEQLSSLGAEIVKVSLPSTEYAVAVYYIVATAEASANLARFDGVRYGYRAENPKDILDLYGRTREEGFGPEVKRRIILGTYVLSSGYYDAYYLRAQKVRELIRNDFSKAFEKVDALISPTSPVPAFKLGERVADPLQMYLADIFTIAANLAGICGISVPCGFAQADGHRLPIGLQLLGKALDETRILQIAHAYEQSTGWQKAYPPIAAPA